MTAINVDYKDFERPTVMRNQSSPDADDSKVGRGDSDYLDIPAFLRRQAD